MNKQKLASTIWESANQMRSKIEANEYKDFILGFIFYKYLSEKELAFFRKERLTNADIEKVMVLRSNGLFNGAKNPQEAKDHLYNKLDRLTEMAARHDSKGIKIKLKEIVAEYTPQENESVF